MAFYIGRSIGAGGVAGLGNPKFPSDLVGVDDQKLGYIQVLGYGISDMGIQV